MDWTTIAVALVSSLFGGGIAALIAARSKSRIDERASYIEVADRLNDIAAETIEKLNKPLRDRIDDLQREVMQYRSGFELASAELNQAKNTISNYEARWANAEADRARLLVQVKMLGQRLTDFETIAGSLHEKIANLEKQNAELNAQVQGFRSVALRRYAEIDELRAELKEKDLRIAQLERQLIERETKHAAEIEARNLERDQLRQQITDLQDKLARLEKTVANGTPPHAGAEAAH